MCSRFELNSTPYKLLNQFGFDSCPIEFTMNEIRPTNPALVITDNQAVTMSWGFALNWSSKLLINARYETLEKKPTFRPLLVNRCLIPATAYFEWRKIGVRRLKNRIAPVGKNVITFAGLHSEEYFIIITCPPAQHIAHIHNRMPLLIEPNERASWINGSLRLEHAVGFLTSPSYNSLHYSEECSLAGSPDLFGV